MDKKNFSLSYYKDAADGMHMQRVDHSEEAQHPHSHEYFQIYYILKGSLLHCTEQESSLLSQGDMFIVPPGRVHSIRQSEPSVFYSFSFMRETLRLGVPGGFANDFLDALAVADRVRAKITVPSHEILLADSIMDGIYKEFTAKQHGYGDVIRAYACILITMFARIYFDTEPEQIHLTPPDNRRQILFAVDFLKTNYAEEISLDEIAQRSALSKSSFCRIFKELTGETFHAYLNRCRINGAKEYIKKGYKISGIYGLCGYSDFSTFYRNFKKITGMSPAAYQQKVR